VYPTKNNTPRASATRVRTTAFETSSTLSGATGAAPLRLLNTRAAPRPPLAAAAAPRCKGAAGREAGYGSIEETGAAAVRVDTACAGATDVCPLLAPAAGGRVEPAAAACLLLFSGDSTRGRAGAVVAAACLSADVNLYVAGDLPGLDMQLWVVRT